MVTKTEIYTSQYGTKSWWINGKRHREDGPAIEWADGHKEWWINGKRHREDGPAIEYASGFKEWYIYGKRHREDGPAAEWKAGFKEWHINGKELSYEEWFEWVMTHSSRENQINVLINMGSW